MKTRRDRHINPLTKIRTPGTNKLARGSYNTGTNDKNSYNWGAYSVARNSFEKGGSVMEEGKKIADAVDKELREAKFNLKKYVAFLKDQVDDLNSTTDTEMKVPDFSSAKTRAEALKMVIDAQYEQHQANPEWSGYSRDQIATMWADTDDLYDEFSGTESSAAVTESADSDDDYDDIDGKWVRVYDIDAYVVKAGLDSPEWKEAMAKYERLYDETNASGLSGSDGSDDWDPEDYSEARHQQARQFTRMLSMPLVKQAIEKVTGKKAIFDPEYLSIEDAESIQVELKLV